MIKRGCIILLLLLCSSLAFAANENDGYCSRAEEKNIQLCSQDCKVELCGDNECTDFDNTCCPEVDCAAQRCGDGVCEQFEAESCLDDCRHRKSPILGKGGIITIFEKESYEYSSDISLVYEERSNTKGLAMKTIIVEDKNAPKAVVNLESAECQTVDGYPFALRDGANNEIEIFEIVESAPQVTLKSYQGFICDDTLFALWSTNKKRHTTQSENLEHYLIVCSESSPRFDLNFNIQTTNVQLRELRSSYCDGFPIKVSNVDLNKGSVVVESTKPKQCKSDAQCDDSDSSTEDTCEGFPSECVHTKINVCVSGDGLCPQSCSENTDTDCKQEDTCSEDAQCDDNRACTLDSCEGFPKECKHKTVEGCPLDDQCVPTGSVIGDHFCNGVSLIEKKEDGSSCQEDYECKNLCSDNACKSQDILVRLVQWISSLFSA